MANKTMITKEDVKRPKDCFECKFFGIISVITTFPSLCEKNLLWLGCGGKEGIKKVA